MKAIWKGSISFGLVNIPVRMYSATSEKVVSFRELHKECGTPLQHKRWCPKCKKEVPWEDVVKGFEYEEGKYVVITPEELQAIKLKSARHIEIIKFVPISSLDPILIEKQYYLAPQEGGEKAFHLFREVLATLGKAAIGRLIMRNKEYLCAIIPYKIGLLLLTLHYAYEIKDINEIEALRKSYEIGKMEEELARKLVESMSGELRIEEYKDRFLEALKELIKEKLSGKEIKPVSEEEEEVGLLEALQKSVEKLKKRKKK